MAAAKALAGEIGIMGRMPVSIPGFSKSGEGRTIPKLEMILKPASSGDLEHAQEGLAKSARLLDSFIEDEIFPGAVLLVGQQGKILLNRASGRTGYSGDSPKTSSDTAYENISLSESVSIASAAMFAIDSGSLLLEAPFKDYLPELNDREIGKLCFRDLLRSRTNKEQKGKPVEEEILRRILSRATGVPMERYLAERLFIPLGMKNTGHTLPGAFRRGVELSPKSRIAGLFSSAQDLGIFAQMLLNRGIYNHRRYFKFETVDTFTGSEILWSKPSASDWTAKVFSPKAFGHFSDSGSLLWMDPSSKLFIVLLANGRPDNGSISEAQRKICESVISALQD